MELRYAEKLKQYSDCPPVRTTVRDGEAFRFVHAAIENPRNFQCAATLSPSREFDTDARRCASWALSFFSSKEKAVAFYQKLKKTSPNIEKTVGTHLARGPVVPADGRVSVDRSDGHFSLWESNEANFSDKFVIIQALSA